MNENMTNLLLAKNKSIKRVRQVPLTSGLKHNLQFGAIIKYPFNLGFLIIYKYLTSITKFITMQPITQNNFVYTSYSQDTLSCPTIPLLWIYYDGNGISNIDYSSSYQTNFLNTKIILNHSLNDGEGIQSLRQKSSNAQRKSSAIKEINASQIYQQASSFKKSGLKRKSIQYSKHSLYSDQDYEPQESSSFELKTSKLSQTKNIPKNYQKAILFFISKNLAYTYKVLKHCQIDFAAFMKYLQGIKKHLGSIAKLRSLWMSSQNPYAKVFRIISKEYMRKYSLGYIFNSRVVNIGKHIKYRQIIQKGIGKPQAFTHMKEY